MKCVVRWWNHATSLPWHELAGTCSNFLPWLRLHTYDFMLEARKNLPTNECHDSSPFYSAMALGKAMAQHYFNILILPAFCFPISSFLLILCLFGWLECHHHYHTRSVSGPTQLIHNGWIWALVFRTWRKPWASNEKHHGKVSTLAPHREICW